MTKSQMIFDSSRRIGFYESANRAYDVIAARALDALRTGSINTTEYAQRKSRLNQAAAIRSLAISRLGKGA